MCMQMQYSPDRYSGYHTGLVETILRHIKFLTRLLIDKFLYLDESIFGKNRLFRSNNLGWQFGRMYRRIGTLMNLTYRKKGKRQVPKPISILTRKDFEAGAHKMFTKTIQNESAYQGKALQ